MREEEDGSINMYNVGGGVLVVNVRVRVWV